MRRSSNDDTSCQRLKCRVMHGRAAPHLKLLKTDSLMSCGAVRIEVDKCFEEAQDAGHWKGCLPASVCLPFSASQRLKTTTCDKTSACMLNMRPGESTCFSRCSSALSSTLCACSSCRIEIAGCRKVVMTNNSASPACPAWDDRLLDRSRPACLDLHPLTSNWHSPLVQNLKPQLDPAGRAHI